VIASECKGAGGKPIQIAGGKAFCSSERMRLYAIEEAAQAAESETFLEMGRATEEAAKEAAQRMAVAKHEQA
jgi:hypothetical protein